MSEEDKLNEEYIKILQTITSAQCSEVDDKFSGVFLPFPNKVVKDHSPRVMLIGRETGGWNRKNKRNTLQRIVDKNETGNLEIIIQEAKERYLLHIQNLTKKTHCHFMRFHARLDNELGHNVFYTNLFAWDYNQKSPLTAPSEQDIKMVKNLSLQLLSVQFQYFKPDFVIFATGYHRVDKIIKDFVDSKLGGFSQSKVIHPKRLWGFQVNNMPTTIFYRINHPRSTDKKDTKMNVDSFSMCRDFVIEEMKKIKEG